MTKKLLGFVFVIIIGVFLSACDNPSTQPKAKNGVKEAKSKVKTQSNGLTVEQENVKRKLEQENMPGAIKHLYVVSAMSGQTIIYSTVKGKVTSSGKRLTNPKTLVRGDRGEFTGNFVFPRLGEDGTYGSSIPYLYWFDVKGEFHKHYVSGGQIIHISSQPLKVKNIIINMESK